MNKLTTLFYNHIKLTYGVKGAYCKWNEFETDMYNYSNDIMSIERMYFLKLIDDDGNFCYNT